MKMKKKIDEFVAAFFPEMQGIQGSTESDTNKLKGVRELAPCSPREVRANAREHCGRKSERESFAQQS
jgi:hypothetical protein